VSFTSFTAFANEVRAGGAGGAGGATIRFTDEDNHHSILRICGGKFQWWGDPDGTTVLMGPDVKILSWDGRTLRAPQYPALVATIVSPPGAERLIDQLRQMVAAVGGRWEQLPGPPFAATAPPAPLCGCTAPNCPGCILCTGTHVGSCGCKDPACPGCGSHLDSLRPGYREYTYH